MVFWNPWHGCTKISPGCKYCYVYRQDKMYGSSKSSSEAVKNRDFGLPMRRSRNGSYKILGNDTQQAGLHLSFLHEKDRQIQRNHA